MHRCYGMRAELLRVAHAVDDGRVLKGPPDDDEQADARDSPA